MVQIEESVESVLYEIGKLSGEYNVSIGTMNSKGDPIENSVTIDVTIRSGEAGNGHLLAACNLRNYCEETDKGYHSTDKYDISVELFGRDIEIESSELPEGFEICDPNVGDYGVQGNFEGLVNSVEKLIKISKICREKTLGE